MSSLRQDPVEVRLADASGVDALFEVFREVVASLLGRTRCGKRRAPDPPRCGLRSRVDALLVGRAPERLVLDVCGLQFLDSSGLRALLACRDRARSADVPLTLAVTPGPVTRLFDVAGVRDWFDHEQPATGPDPATSTVPRTPHPRAGADRPRGRRGPPSAGR